MTQDIPPSGSVAYLKLLRHYIVASLTLCGSISIATATVFTVTSATQVDPPGGATIYYTNPNFTGTNAGFVNWTGEAFTPESASVMTALNGFSILNFETASGFGAAPQALTATGTIFAGTGTIAPYVLTDQVNSVVVDSGTIGVEWRGTEDAPNILYGPDATNGVFLVRDRPANDTMTSGTQGLIAGRIIETPETGGMYLTFDQNLSDFGVVLNNNSSSNPSVSVSFFDEDGAQIARYRMGVASGKPLFLGINSPTGIIRSVWIGQKYSTNGLVIDDVAFKKAAPEMVVLSSTFSGTGSTTGWLKSPGVTVTENPNYATLQASNGDSKIYKTIPLAAGDYVLSGAGSGALRLMVLSSWSNTVATLSLGSPLSSGVFRSDHHVFHLATSGTAYVVAQVWTSGTTGTTANLQSIQVEKARLTPYAYDTVGMQATRPSPAIVRGMNTPQFEVVTGTAAASPATAAVVKDFTDAASWGAAVMRLQLHPAYYAAHYAPGHPQDFWTAWKTNYLTLVESWVVAAQNAHVKLVISLQEPPFTAAELAAGPPNFWSRADLADRYCRVWRDLVTLGQKYPATIWGYDICNEPLDTEQLPNEPRQWWPLAENIRHTIRTLDTGTSISWMVYEPGPGGEFSGFSDLRPFPDTHVTYSAHFYFPEAFTMQGVEGRPRPVYYSSGTTYTKSSLIANMAPAKTFTDTWNVPFFTGEFSTARWSPEPDSESYLSDVISLNETYGWSWAYFAFRESTIFDLEEDTQYTPPGTVPAATPTPTPSPDPAPTGRELIIRTGMAP